VIPIQIRSAQDKRKRENERAWERNQTESQEYAGYED
jgi:hypothetical protein